MVDPILNMGYVEVPVAIAVAGKRSKKPSGYKKIRRRKETTGSMKRARYSLLIFNQ